VVRAVRLRRTPLETASNLGVHRGA
jgi:hypothetical protein